MKYVVGFIAFCISFFTGVIISDNSHFKIRKYRVKNDKVTKPLRVVLLSDLHGKEYGKKNKDIVNAVMKMKPDFIVMAGDMITAKIALSVEPMKELIAQLSKVCPVYYGIGNHEARLKNFPGEYEKVLTEAETLGAVVLDNESVYLPEWNIALSGLNVEKCFYDKWNPSFLSIKDMEAYAIKQDGAAFQMLIAHNPEFFETYAAWGADLTLSGHLHGGIMVLPFLGGVISPRFQLFPKYDGGLFEIGDKKMVLSRGLGSHTLPIRIFNPGEMVVIDLEK